MKKILPKIDSSVGARIFSALEVDMLGYPNDKRNKLVKLNYKGVDIVINKLVLEEKILPTTICARLGFTLVDDKGKPVIKKK